MIGCDPPAEVDHRASYPHARAGKKRERAAQISPAVARWRMPTGLGVVPWGSSGDAACIQHRRCSWRAPRMGRRPVPARVCVVDVEGSEAVRQRGWCCVGARVTRVVASAGSTSGRTPLREPLACPPLTSAGPVRLARHWKLCASVLPHPVSETRRLTTHGIGWVHCQPDERSCTHIGGRRGLRRRQHCGAAIVVVGGAVHEHAHHRWRLEVKDVGRATLSARVGHAPSNGIRLELEATSCWAQVLVVSSHRHSAWPIGKQLNPVQHGPLVG
mmetsp:Transcript_32471/g.108362  ORF Transcript_32471/g.108362 Transcript_32471/m.108362 type:complete len:272 (+) Transcript_32471:565-1380(+)